MSYLSLLAVVLAVLPPAFGDTPVTAIIEFAPNDNFVTGTITLKQQNIMQPVSFNGTIEGLKPGKPNYPTIFD